MPGQSREKAFAFRNTAMIKLQFFTSELLSQMQQPEKEYSGLGYIIKELTNGAQMVCHPGDNRGWSSIFAIIPLESTPIVGMILLTIRVFHTISIQRRIDS